MWVRVGSFLVKPEEVEDLRRTYNEQAILRWITLAVGTDHVPLLVSACSTACVSALPAPAEGYVQEAHVGGASLVQPPSDLALLDARIAARRPLGD